MSGLTFQDGAGAFHDGALNTKEEFKNWEQAPLYLIRRYRTREERTREKRIIEKKPSK